MRSCVTYGRQNRTIHHPWPQGAPSLLGREDENEKQLTTSRTKARREGGEREGREKRERVPGLRGTCWRVAGPCLLKGPPLRSGPGVPELWSSVLFHTHEFLAQQFCFPVRLSIAHVLPGSPHMGGSRVHCYASYAYFLTALFQIHCDNSCPENVLKSPGVLHFSQPLRRC